MLKPMYDSLLVMSLLAKSSKFQGTFEQIDATADPWHRLTEMAEAQELSERMPFSFFGLGRAERDGISKFRSAAR
jgi:hypothetical protein